MIGLLLALLLMLLLPFTGTELLPAQAVLIALGASCEFTIVSLLSLFSEQYPQARATLFSLVSFGISIGLGIASPLAVALWDWSGLAPISVLAALSLGVALLLTQVWLHENAPS